MESDNQHPPGAQFYIERTIIGRETTPPEWYQSRIYDSWTGAFCALAARLGTLYAERGYQVITADIAGTVGFTVFDRVEKCLVVFVIREATPEILADFEHFKECEEDQRQAALQYIDCE